MKHRVDARLDELGAAYGLSAPAGEQLRRLLDGLADAEDGPTSVREPQLAVDVHIADSLVGLTIPAVRAARVVADLGSGAGFPALPLAVALPDARVIAVESQGRKARFVTDLATAAGIDNVDVVTERAEAWAGGVGRCDVVTVRAVASLAVLCEYAAPLLTIGGTLVAWKAAVTPDEGSAGDRAAALLGLSPVVTHEVTPYRGARDLRLCCFVKQDATPARFPRRSGVAAKRPLG